VEPSSRDDAALKTRAEEVFDHLDAQLARTAQLTARTGEFLSGRGRD
jgi:DNA mismatch repair protein MutH